MSNPNEKKMSFFVRCEDTKANIDRLFDAKYVELNDNENAFVTELISQNELEQKLSKLTGVISFIRIMEN